MSWGFVGYMTVAQIFGLAYGPCATTYPGNLTDDDQPNQNLAKNMVTSRRSHCFEAQPLVMLQNRYINFNDCIVGNITTYKYYNILQPIKPWVLMVKLGQPVELGSISRSSQLGMVYTLASCLRRHAPVPAGRHAVGAILPRRSCYRWALSELQIGAP